MERYAYSRQSAEQLEKGDRVVIFRFTRAGIHYILFTMLIGALSINSGNNLFYLLFGMMLSFIIISGVISRVTLRNLFFFRTLPEDIFAGIPTWITIAVENRKKRCASYSLHVTDRIQHAPSCHHYLIRLGHREKASFRHSYTFSRRGRYQLGPLQADTSYPFGLFLKGKRIPQQHEVIVYPRIDAIPRLHLDQLAAHEGVLSRGRKGQGTELFNIRPYIYGEDSKFICWKISAKSPDLMVKEFSSEDRRLTVIFENHVPRGQKERDARLDQAADVAASLVFYLIRNNFSIRFAARQVAVPFGQGASHMQKIMRFLALVTPVQTTESSLPIYEHSARKGAPCILIFPGEEQDLPPERHLFTKIFCLASRSPPTFPSPVHQP